MPQGTITPQDAGSSVPVGTSSTPVKGENLSRWEIELTNTSPNWIYVQKATSGAALNQGIPLAPNGGSWSSAYYNGPLCAIASAAGSNLCVSET